MPRVETSIAAKDYPNQGIKKGEKYWHWTPYRQAKRRSKTPPRPSQYESNETKAQVYSACESLEDFLRDADDSTSAEDIQGAIDDCKTAAEEAKDAMEEKASNIEDGFGHETEQSTQFREWAEMIETWISELEGIEAPVDNRAEVLEELSSHSDGPEL